MYYATNIYNLSNDENMKTILYFKLIIKRISLYIDSQISYNFIFTFTYIYFDAIFPCSINDI